MSINYRSSRDNRHALRQLHKEFTSRAFDRNQQVTKRKRLVRPFSQGDVGVTPSLKTSNYEEVAAQLHEQLSYDKPWYLLDPEGNFSRIWNVFAVILIYMLLFYLPFLVAYFDEPAHCNYLSLEPGSRALHGGISGHAYNPGWQIFPIFTNAFFLADIMVNLMTGVEDREGNRDYSLSAIARRYLLLWFWVDAISCIPLECVFYTIAPNVYWYNIPKFIRLLRLAGIKRRSQGDPFRFIDRVSDLRQEFSFSARRIIVAAVYILIVVHWFACTLWWTIRLQNYPADTWPSQLDIARGSVMEQWLFSVFSIVSGMIGLGYGSYPPITWGEALVWVFAMLATATMFAVMNGFIIATILSSASSRHRYKERMDMIMETTDTRDLPENLRRRIIEYFKYKYRDGKVRNQEEVLRELPYDMQAEVALHSAGPLLSKVSLIAEEPTLMERVALMLHPSFALKGEQVLKQGWPGRSMYFVRSGFVDLVMDGAVVDTIQPGDYFGEVALLALPPTHELLQVCGHAAEDISNYKELFPSIFTARALTNCDMFTLDAEEFHQVVQEYPKVQVKLHAWAVRHAKRLLKYGFDLGPQFSPDSNLPPDDGDSIPASVRRSAPSNVVLNIADLRNSMLETALEEEDAPSPLGHVPAGPELQALSPQEQQALFLSKDTLADVLGSSQGAPSSGQASVDDRLSGGNLAQNSQKPTHSEDGQHWGGVDDSHGAEEGAMSRDLQDPVVGGSAQDVGARHYSIVRQSGRNSSAVRRMQSRPGLASVRFAEEPPDPCEDQGPIIHQTQPGVNIRPDWE
ncbi:Potassium/sodium hyperpolarization-activated cyclic nucleotide-gated channel 3 [Trebouxia sp. C0009 RCD-2024]